MCLKVGVMGAGAIGCFVGGKLQATGVAEVVFVGRERLQKELADNDMRLLDLESAPQTLPSGQVTYVTDPSCLSACDVVLCCVKTLQTSEVAETLSGILAPGALVVSLQNGVGNAALIREHLHSQRVLPGVVDFNVLSKGGGVFQRTTNGSIQVEDAGSEEALRLFDAFVATGLTLERYPTLAPQQYTKLLINLNNAVIALSGRPTREVLLSRAYRRLMAAVIEEALEVMRGAGIEVAKLRGISPALIPHGMRLPTWLFRILFGTQLRVDPEARSSMWDDLERGRLTEVDTLNGEIVRLAKRHNLQAPINEGLVRLVHLAEREGGGSPAYQAEQLWPVAVG